MTRALVRSGRGRLHVADPLDGIGWLGVCGSLIQRPLGVEAMTPATAERVVDAKPGDVCHYCRLTAVAVRDAVERAVAQAVELAVLDATGQL